jgi:hypothetical protein
MTTMCLAYFESYSDIWSKPCCGCKSKTIGISVELISVVQLFINMGFKIISANCSTRDDQDGRCNVGSTHLKVVFILNIFLYQPI